jgi:hypothetical protein
MVIDDWAPPSEDGADHVRPTMPAAVTVAFLPNFEVQLVAREL